MKRFNHRSHTKWKRMVHKRYTSEWLEQNEKKLQKLIKKDKKNAKTVGNL